MHCYIFKKKCHPWEARASAGGGATRRLNQETSYFLETQTAAARSHGDDLSEFFEELEVTMTKGQRSANGNGSGDGIEAGKVGADDARALTPHAPMPPAPRVLASPFVPDRISLVPNYPASEDDGDDHGDDGPEFAHALYNTPVFLPHSPINENSNLNRDRDRSVSPMGPLLETAHTRPSTPHVPISPLIRAVTEDVDEVLPKLEENVDLPALNFGERDHLDTSRDAVSSSCCSPRLQTADMVIYRHPQNANGVVRPDFQ